MGRNVAEGRHQSDGDEAEYGHPGEEVMNWGKEFVRGLPHEGVPGVFASIIIGGSAGFRHRGESDNRGRLSAVAIARRADPAWLKRRDEGNELCIGERDPGR